MRAVNYDARVLANEPQSHNIFLLTVHWDTASPRPAPGQFYMLRAWAADEAPLLSRPISLHTFDAENAELTFLYEVKGIGTQKLAQLKKDDTVQLTGPMGTGFPLKKGETVALVGGGIGTAPLLALANALRDAGVEADFYAGFRDEPYRLAPFVAVCRAVHVATDSGNYGHKGLVTELLRPAKYDAVYTCGPEPMMEAVARMCIAQNVPVYVSKEAKMACGLGACLGCTCKTKSGAPASVCKDGPVFDGSVLYG
jgi:dihydroorotate dehydrogenase electron transfer subunit